jgi:drug/metabolite transporter (DMT)-like permease
MAYYFPILLIVGSNVLYHICAKSVPLQLNPMVSLMITYLVAGSLTLFMFFLMPHLFSIDKKLDMGLIYQIKQANWAPFVLGFVIVGLELGNILMYRAGWNISLGSLVSNISLAVLLLIIGIFFYKEVISLSQTFGISLCIAGLIFINK